MKDRGKFNIPVRPDMPVDGVRREYRRIWGREWPHGDDYLRELVSELPRRGKRCRALLEAMRLDHDVSMGPR